jgi:lipopolysaccharide export system protein LptA
MSAIAVLCALNCAIASVSDGQAALPQQLAQLPIVQPQELEPTLEPTFNQDSINQDLINGDSIPTNLGNGQIVPPETISTPEFSDQPVQEIIDSAQELTIEDVTPQEPEPEFNGVQIQDRSGNEQAFPLEATVPEKTLRVLEVIGDRQEYDEIGQIVTAVGNVIVRFNNGVLTADNLQINLNTKLAIATGNVALQRGSQLLRGERFDYFFVQNRGYIRSAQGEVLQNNLNQDLSLQPSAALNNPGDPTLLLNERLLLQQPTTNVRGTGDGLNINIGSDRNIPQQNITRESGTINRVRFYAEDVEFYDNRWEAKNVRLTNDPFNPPELELTATTATYRQVDELTDELVTTDTRMVFDDNVSLPVFPRTYRFSKSDDQGIFSIVSIGYDDEERGGLYLQRQITIFKDERGQWSITPQYLVQKAFFPDTPLGQSQDTNSVEIFSPDVFGVTSKFNYNFNPRFFIVAKGSLPSLRLEELEDRLKVNIRVEQLLGNLGNPFRLSQEFNYRDRLFNGSLGFQRVQRSLGLVLRSPQYRFGNSGFSLNYQASLQNIQARTDRAELIDANNRGDRLVNLTRYQGTVALNHGLQLWRGESLPATRDLGLRYSSQPIVPYLSLNTGIRGVASLYSNNDQQISVIGSIGIQGQLGHLSRNFLDYTGFNITYTTQSRGETSPFLFDRIADRQTINFGIAQQIYGPIIAGFQTSLNIDTNEAISTDYFLQYKRRTHSVMIRYNPVLEIGSLSFKINDFNWNGTTDPFVNQDIRPVIDGVIP